MATLLRKGDDLVVSLSTAEKVGALHGDLRVPRTAVRAVEVAPTPFAAIKGLRAPGTGIPRVIALGTWRYRGGKDLVLAHRHHAGAVVVELTGQEFERVIVSADDPDAVAQRIR